jgi:hypothetical protein
MFVILRSSVGGNQTLNSLNFSTRHFSPFLSVISSDISYFNLFIRIYFLHSLKCRLMPFSALKQTRFLSEPENIFFRQHEAREVALHFRNLVTVLTVVEIRGQWQK